LLGPLVGYFGHLCLWASRNGHGSVTAHSLFCHLAHLNNRPRPSKAVRRCSQIGYEHGEKRTTMDSIAAARDTAVGPPTQLTHEQQQQLVMQYAPLVRRVARSLPLEIPGLL